MCLVSQDFRSGKANAAMYRWLRPEELLPVTLRPRRRRIIAESFLSASENALAPALVETGVQELQLEPDRRLSLVRARARLGQAGRPVYSHLHAPA